MAIGNHLQTGSDHATWKISTVLVKIIILYIFEVI